LFLSMAARARVRVSQLRFYVAYGRIQMQVWDTLNIDPNYLLDGKKCTNVLCSKCRQKEQLNNERIESIDKLLDEIDF